MAGHATVTREEVSRWENGRRNPGRFWLPHLATALQVPVEVLEADPVRRRAFLTDMAAGVIAPASMSELLRSGFAHALTRPGIDDWHARVDAYGRDYMSQGAAQIQQRLAGDMIIIQQEVERSRMWAVAARLATTFGKTIPGSDGDQAVKWYSTAAELADRSGDLDTRIWVRGRAAIALGYEGAALPTADRFANEAIALSDRPSLGVLNAVMGKAHVAALRGDRDGARTLLERGRRIFDTAASDEQESDFAVPEWRMNVFISLLAARLGDERTALEAQRDANRLLPKSLPRFRTHLRMHQGLMRARAGDTAQGIDLARAALNELPAEKHSLTLRLLMDEVEKTGSSAATR